MSQALADYMHAKNVSFGIYSDMGTRTCGGYPGTQGHEKIDAETMAAWGVDYLKLDGCNIVGGQDGCKFVTPAFPSHIGVCHFARCRTARRAPKLQLPCFMV